MISENIRKILVKVQDIASSENVCLYIVGGFIRDLLVKSDLESYDTIDVDFSLDKNVINFVKKIALPSDSKFIILGREFSTVRIILKTQDKLIYQLDFTQFKGNDINVDLKHRDFTINSFAIKLGEFIKLKNLGELQEKLIFPTTALKDLKNKKIIPVTPSSFKEDPLRLIRAFSIGAQIKFQIPEQILSMIKKEFRLLKNISSERIRDELFRLFSVDNSYNYISEMAEYGVLGEVFPELKKCKGVKQGPYHHLDVYYHSIECIKEFELLLPNIYKDDYLRPRIKKYLNEKLAYKRSRECLIKLALLYHDVGKPVEKKVEDGKIKFWGHEKVSRDMVNKRAEELKLSNSEKRSLENMVYYHLRPGNLVEQEEITQKAACRFFRHAGRDTPAIILLSIADKYATAGELITKESMDKHKRILMKLLKRYFVIQETVEPKKLINGDEIIKMLDIEPSPLVGKILEEVKILQMQGEIRNKQEALKFAKNYKT